MTTTSFTNPAGITIADESVESQTLAVTGLAGPVVTLTVTLDGFSHTFPGDVRFLLVGPNGTSNLDFLSFNVNDGAEYSNDDLTFSDSASGFLPQFAGPTDGTFLPTDRTGDGPSDWNLSISPLNFAGPLGLNTFASVFGGVTANGTWTLYVADTQNGDDGSLASWTLSITTPDVPIIANPDTVVVSAGADPVSVGIAAPLDPNSLTITLTTLPSYGTLQFFDGTTWVDATVNDVVTAAELASLRYEAPASGEHGGDELVYTVDDGVNAVKTGTVEFSVEVDSAGPAGLFFSAFTGPGNGGPVDLYTLDANGDPVAIPINLPNGSLAGEDGGFFQFAGDLYFNAATAPTGEALFKMDPGGQVTAVDDGSGGFFGVASLDAHFTEFAGSLYFRADTVDGDQLVKLDASGTSQVIVLNPGGQAASPGANGGFVEFDHSLYFSAFTPTSGSNNPDLIKLDADGTVTDISTRSVPSDGSDPGDGGGLIVFNNALYFNSLDDSGDLTLFRLDAGSTTPVLVDASLSNPSFTDSAFHAYNDNLYFNEADTTYGNGTLFQLDASGTLTALTYLGDALVGAGALGGMIDFAGSMFFVADTGFTNGTALFRLDPNGLITDVYDDPGAAGAFDAGHPGGFTQFNGSLYFDAFDSFTGSDSLFKLDADGTLTTVDLGGPPGSANAGLEGGFKVLGDNLYFSAETADGYELVRIDSSGTPHVVDVVPGPDNSEAGSISGFGVFPFTVLHGTGGPDVIAGGSNNEIIDAGGGNDVIYPRGGNDVITGGDGADRFVFDADGPANIATITDYSFAGGDVIDLSALLDTYFGPDSNVMDFARIVAVGQNLVVQVDPDGPLNGSSWTDVAVLEGANTTPPFSAGPFPEVTAFFGGTDHTLVTLDVQDLRTVALAGGGWVETWAQSTADDTYGGTYLDLYARVFDANGVQIGGTITVGDPNDGMDDQFEQVTALPNGDFAITWQNCEETILTKVYNGAGVPISGTEAVVTGVNAPLLAQSIVLSNGGYAVLWGEIDTFGAGGDNMYVATFDGAGNAVSGTVPVNAGGHHPDDPTTSFGASDVAELKEIVPLQNDFAVVWQSNRDTGPSGFNETSEFVRLFQNDGTPVTGEIQANSTDGGATSADNGFADTQAEIVPLGLGGNDFALFWESDGFSASQIYTRFFTAANGYTGGTPIEVDTNADPSADVQAWHATALAGGGVAELWFQSDGVNTDLYVQTFDASGNIGAGSQVGGVKVDQVSGENSPWQVLALTGGGFAVVFDSTRDDGTGSGPDGDVYVRTFAADGSPTSDEVKLNTPDGVDDSAEEAIALSDGSFLVLWSHAAADNSHEDLYVRHVGADGTLLSPQVFVTSSPNGAANESSDFAEFRTAMSTNQALLVAEIDSDSLDSNAVFPDFPNTFYSPATQFFFPPTATSSSGVTLADEQVPTAVDAGLTVADPGGSGIASATVSIASGLHSAEDVLAFANTDSATFGDIAGSYDAGTGVLTLTSAGGATVGEWQSALEAVTYTDTSDTPNTTPREVSFVVDGAVFDSAAVTKTVDVAPVNDPPVNTVPGAQHATPATDLAIGGISIFDPDAGSAAMRTTLTVLDGTLTVAAVGGATVGGSGTATVTIDGSQAQIDATLGAAGNIVYHGNSGFTGTDTLTVLTDDMGHAGPNVSNPSLTDSDTVAINVHVNNTAPAAGNDSYATNEDTALVVAAASGVLHNDTDADNDALSAHLVAGPAHGSLTLNLDGSFSYAPAANYNGSDSFTYKANDGTADSGVATVSLTVNAVNDPPVLAHFGSNHDAATEQTFIKLNPLATVSDVELDALNGGAGNYSGASLIIGRTVAANTDDTFGFSTSGASFTVDTAHHTLLAGGHVFATYSIPSSGPNEGTIGVNFTSQDTPATTALVDDVLQHIAYENLNDAPPASVTMHVTVHDGNTGAQGAGGDGVDTANRVVDIAPVDDAPVAHDGAASGNEDTVITGSLSASDIDSSTLTYLAVTQPAHGSVAIDAAHGTFSYTPDANYFGTDSFTFTANDGSLNSNVATESLTITPVDDAPVAHDGAASGNQDTVITGSLSATDIDSSTLTYLDVTQPAHGSVTIDATHGTFSYAPDADYSGSDSFTFKANDGSLDSNVATESLTVNAITPVNHAPTDILLSHAAVDEYAANGTVVGALSDVDPDAGDTASFSLVDDAGGRFAVSGSNLVVANYIGLDYEQSPSHSVTVEVTDSGGLTFDKAFTIDVNDINPETVGGPATDDTILGGALNDNINGGGGNDFIVGGAGDDWLGGGSGDDQVSGGDGNDVIWGEDGNDNLGGGAGNDVILGGAGNDTIGGDDGNDAINGGDGNDVIFGGAGDDQLGGGAGDDTILGGDGNDVIWGEDGNDNINAGAGNDIVLGGAGNDQIGGGTGDDILRGEAGNDVLWGEDGNDTLEGGPGNDIMIGGAGADTFVFRPGDGNDTVVDFTPAGADADRVWLAGTNLHSFADVLAHASFDPSTGATTITHDGTDTIVLNGVAPNALAATNFVFS